MKATEPPHAALAGAFFDQVLIPLAQARTESGAAPYFPTRHDASLSSYFTVATVTSMSAADFEFVGGGRAETLVAELAKLWRREGDTVLADAAPKLAAIAAAIGSQTEEDDGSVEIFCYTLF